MPLIPESLKLGPERLKPENGLPKIRTRQLTCWLNCQRTLSHP